MAVDVIKDMLSHHTDEEIISYISKVANGLVKNYQAAIKVNQPEILYGNLGDLTIVSEILKAMKHRNDEREAQRQSMIK